MTAKQILNSGSAPDGSLYVTLTDGAGNLTTTGNVTIGTTPISGGATTQVLFNLGGVVSSDSGFTYAGSGGVVGVTGVLQFVTNNPGVIKSPNFGSLNYWGNNHYFFSYDGTKGSAIFPQADGVFTLINTAGTSFGRVQLGGSTSSFPAIKRNSAAIAFRLADDSADCSITCAGISSSTTVNDTGYDYQTPTTGGTVTLSNSKCHCIIDPAGTLATLTVNMPATPTDGMIVDVRFSQIVTTLTVSGNGNSIKGNPSSAAVGSQFTAIYRATNTTWYI